MEFEFNQLQQPVGLSVSGWIPSLFPSSMLMSGNFCRLAPENFDAEGGQRVAISALPPLLVKQWG